MTREFEKPVVLNTIAARSSPIAIVLSASFLVLALVACGSGGASPGSNAQTITAQVCTDGEERDTRLYVRNLDDFEWIDLEISVSKGGETYSQELASLLPESQAIAPPLSNSGDFFYYLGGSTQQPGGKSGLGSVRQSDRYNLGSFAHTERLGQPGEDSRPAPGSNTTLELLQQPHRGSHQDQIPVQVGVEVERRHLGVRLTPVRQIASESHAGQDRSPSPNVPS
ncbi:MAG: hypothetical protein O3A47_01575 [Chloroflexi bacterium]|nr:hypothetical protein [Chloroflexota bacterium]